MSGKKPTDVDRAVALQYSGSGAPRITAKADGALAQRIAEVAEEHDIPLYDEPGLAAALAQIPLGDEIPQNLYRAVAEILVFAYALAGKMPPGYGPGGKRD
jgi:flagellar biosynthesis protein